MPIFVCRTCQCKDTVATLINKKWIGWNIKGKLEPVNNYCCPDCGSNDIVYLPSNPPSTHL